ncbi:ABC transporter permease [Parablautia intestinalis]|uniref:ABC transporter permease n=1 Tax=Parablautia intestinalis TaxID=2320100 RepID=UPI003AB96187
MGELLGSLKCECIKLKRSKILLIGLLGTLIAPLFVYVKADINHLSNPDILISVFTLYDDAIMFLMLLFCNQLNHCCPVKFTDSRMLSVASFQSSCHGTNGRTGLSQRNLILR